MVYNKLLLIKPAFSNIRRHQNLRLDYVPKHSPVREEDVQLLKRFIQDATKILVLTGAGISTESGIPDYRSEDVGLYARTNHKPIQYQEFLNSPNVRKRYWARNFVGWPRFSGCQPNATHQVIRNLELDHGKLSCLVTQNVDGLHSKAGSRNVIELHGSAFRVHCLHCNEIYNRHDVQFELHKTNPAMNEIATMVRPDGDVEISQEKIWDFKTPSCTSCGGILKPDIVFFGDNVPKERVDKVRKNVTSSDSLLVLGSSLSVFSSYRIVLQALEESKKICIVNIGPTRADKLVPLKITAKCGDLLTKL